VRGDAEFVAVAVAPGRSRRWAGCKRRGGDDGARKPEGLAVEINLTIIASQAQRPRLPGMG
jgi:hypothetical protein